MRERRGAARVALAAAGAFGLLAVLAGALGFGGVAGAMAAGMLVSLLLAPWATR